MTVCLIHLCTEEAGPWWLLKKTGALPNTAIVIKFTCLYYNNTRLSKIVLGNEECSLYHGCKERVLEKDKVLHYNYTVIYCDYIVHHNILKYIACIIWRNAFFLFFTMYGGPQEQNTIRNQKQNSKFRNTTLKMKTHQLSLYKNKQWTCSIQQGPTLWS